MTPEPLAHSPRLSTGPQSYFDHIEGTARRAERNAQRATQFYTGDRSGFVETVSAAAIFHDLGKLHEANQEVLARQSRDPLPRRHEDAGTAHLIQMNRMESAVLVAAHHAGLFSTEQESRKVSRAFRIEGEAAITDRLLDAYLSAHVAARCPEIERGDGASLHRNGLTRRIALSCLVDADHSDTAEHYQNEIPLTPVDGCWAERLEALDKHVARLGVLPSARGPVRARVYRACRDAAIEPPMRSCDAAVGGGKTTAVAAHLLRVAEARGLRHIFVVLPYVNIIDQSVKTYREALVLPGENPEDVVAAHHHRADFESPELRRLSTLWRTPIIVTTAVQFFETLGAHRPAQLRKLHELAGSAIFIDEAHAALPAHLWRQAWRWLESLCTDWGGHVILGSGSLPRFWQEGDFVYPPKDAQEVPDLLPDAIREELDRAELVRVVPRYIEGRVTCDQLIAHVVARPGPRVVILNTVQSAAVVARRMRKLGHDVVHLSTALTPIHRLRVVEKVQERLADRSDRDWTLVATSCIEAGMNFSFRVGFRERGSASSFLQTGGRVGREGEFFEAEVWDFQTDDPLLKDNPGIEMARRAFTSLIEAGLVGRLTASELALEAMKRELTEGTAKKADALTNAETGMEYPTVSELCRVIEHETCTVVIDEDLADRVARREPVDRRELLQNSVQIWSPGIRNLPISPVLGDSDDHGGSTLYRWNATYDPKFLGYMEGALPYLQDPRSQLLLV